MLFRIMGFGQAPNPQAEAGRVHHLRESFGPSLRVVADAVGLAFDGIEASGQTALARKQIKIAAGVVEAGTVAAMRRSEEHTSELQSLMRISYAVFCLKKKKHTTTDVPTNKS